MRKINDAMLSGWITLNYRITRYFGSVTIELQVPITDYFWRPLYQFKFDISHRQNVGTRGAGMATGWPAWPGDLSDGNEKRGHFIQWERYWEWISHEWNKQVDQLHWASPKTWIPSLMNIGATRCFPDVQQAKCLVETSAPDCWWHTFGCVTNVTTCQASLALPRRQPYRVNVPERWAKEYNEASPLVSTWTLWLLLIDFHSCWISHCHITYLICLVGGWSIPPNWWQYWYIYIYTDNTIEYLHIIILIIY